MTFSESSCRILRQQFAPLIQPHIASLDQDLQWKAVDTAAEELAISAKALQAFDDEAEEKTILENSVSRLREDLPSDTRHYYYNCGMSLRSILCSC